MYIDERHGTKKMESFEKKKNPQNKAIPWWETNYGIYSNDLSLFLSLYVI